MKEKQNIPVPPLEAKPADNSVPLTEEQRVLGQLEALIKRKNVFEKRSDTDNPRLKLLRKVIFTRYADAVELGKTEEARKIVTTA